jgi:hypothetical protein
VKQLVPSDVMQHDSRFKEALSLRAGDILQQSIPVALCRLGEPQRPDYSGTTYK